MNSILLNFVVLISIVIFATFINEKTLKLPTEIALLIVSVLIGIVLLLVQSYGVEVQMLNFQLDLLDEFLVKGVLCFMLFSGSYGIHIKTLKSQSKTIAMLAIISTLLSALVFASLFYGLTLLIGLSSITFMHCLLLGCIISPTDPIAAMSILTKVGLPEETAITIEGESLFNDGVGVALFVVVLAAIQNGQSSIDPLEFSGLLVKELCGGIIVGIIISFLLSKLFVNTNDTILRVFISLLTVSLAYVICEEVGVSSAISAVICGIYYANILGKKHEEKTPEYVLFKNFWEVFDKLLNGLVYVLLGLSSVSIISYIDSTIIWILVALICCIIARYAGVGIVSFLIKKRPNGLSRSKFVNLLTYAGLRGALSLALVTNTSSALSEKVFHILLISTFGIILFTTIVQGLTIGKFYKKYY